VDLAEYVLSPPPREELPALSRAADRAAQLAWLFLTQGLEAALDAYARRG
jgi:peptidyl-tRNA hydrolase